MRISYRRPHNAFYRPVLGRALEDFFRHTGASAEAGEEDVAESAWTPAVDVKEGASALELFVELPGVSRDAIDISLESGVLTVAGERRFDEAGEEGYRRIERVYGKFHRSFRVPRDVDGSRVAASYSDGVLHLELPKVEAAKPRQIEIK